MWLLYAFLSSISWCFVTIFGKLASQRVEPNLLTTLRAILMSVMLVAAAIISRRISFEACYNIQAKDWAYIALAALFSSVAWLFYFSAFKYGLIAKVVSIDRLNFVFIIFLSAYLFGEELTWSIIAGTLLMVTGVVVIALA